MHKLNIYILTFKSLFDSFKQTMIVICIQLTGKKYCIWSISASLKWLRRSICLQQNIIFILLNVPYSPVIFSCYILQDFAKTFICIRCHYLFKISRESIYCNYITDKISFTALTKLHQHYKENFLSACVPNERWSILTHC